MRYIYTAITALLLGSMAAQAADYQPLVREGVVWHYCYFDHEIAEQYECDGLVDNKIEFYGDTILNEIEYKKCYLYRTESLDPNMIPVAYAREENGKVMIVVEGMQYGSMPDDWETHSLPGQYENLTGERIVYDFGDMAGFLSQLESEGTVVSTTYAQVGENNVRLYTVDMGQNCHFVESVGRDDEYSGYMFMPFVERETCYCSEVMGLIKLTDLDGNTLYKGTYYDDFNTDEPADYQPLVREGVRWVNVHEAIDHIFFYYSCYIYNFEFRGDTIINGKTYKKCYKYTGKTLDLSKDSAYCAMRDEGHKVYEVPFAAELEYIDGMFPDWYAEYLEKNEFTLFDFDNPIVPRSPAGRGYKLATSQNTSALDRFVPGIGYNGEIDGDAFHPFTNLSDFDCLGFHHLEDLSGNILFEGAAYDRSEYVYTPLMREGVVWEYLYLNNDMTCAVERYQLLGDTAIIIHDSQPPHNFKKCYRYFGEHFDSDNLSPIAYMEEWGRTVSVITPPIAQHRRDEFVSEFGGTYSLPSYLGYEKTGEREIYWFEAPSVLMQDVNELYGCDYFSANDSVLSFVAVGDQMNRCFDITGIDMVGGKWIEGVGIDGLHTGNLIAPLAPSGETGTQGLIRLADLDGNTLYKGAYYDTYNSIDRVADDASAAADPRWYDLLGHPFDSRPTQPGVYIHQGKKVVVK